MTIRIDTESSKRAGVILAYLHHGDEHLADVLRDGFLTGLLSRDVEDELRHELARDDLTFAPSPRVIVLSPTALPPPVPPLALPARPLRVGPANVLRPTTPPQRVRASPSDDRPALIQAATEKLSQALGIGAERTADLYAAAMRVGLRRLDPSHRYPVQTYPHLYSPPVGTARIQ